MTSRNNIYAIFLLSVAVAALLSFIGAELNTHQIPDVCIRNSLRPDFTPDPNRINERSVLFPHDAYVLKNVTLIDGDGKVFSGIDILIQNGTIAELGSLSLQGIKEIDLKGKFVTPGLIDVHSHFGTRAQPQLRATEDTNEYVSPATPYVRSIDGINPNDPEMPSLLASGVTSHLVLTGSKNLLSGESYAIKMHQSPNNLVEELLIQYNVTSPKLVRWFKIAYGENQKALHLPGYPVSRMGEAWVLRSTFNKGLELKTSQDKWCSDPKLWNTEYPSDYELNTVADILRGDLNLNVHLYETYDFETLLRVADEFGVSVGSFHHALSSYKVIKLLQEHNSSIAIFADEWGGKKEQYEATVHAPRILAENGIPVALKTDHPALPGQDLLYYAQISHNFGLSPQLSIASVTSVPAKMMSMDHRIGYARKGYDADLVVWDSHPLTLGVKAVDVIVDGIAMFDFKKLARPLKESVVSQRKFTPKKCDSSFLVTGIKSLLKDSSYEQSDNLVALVENGNLTCVGSTDFCQKEGVSIINLENGFLLPGITAIAPSIGLTEMTLEEDTSDGIAKDYNEMLSAKDGLKLDGLVLERLENSGVKISITAPIGDNFLKGISTRFSLGAKNLEDGILNEEVAIHFTIGSKAKSPKYPTISSQIKALREFLLTDDSGLPIVIHTHNKPVMQQIVQLKKQFKRTFIILGGQESYLIAEELAQNDIYVILSPWRCTAKFWENRRCSPNTPLMEDSSVNILSKAGVKFALGQDSDNSARRTLWEAGLAGKSIDGYNLKDVVSLVSYNLEEMFGVEPSNDYVIFDGNPFEFGASLAMSFTNGKLTKCYPNYEESSLGNELFV